MKRRLSQGISLALRFVLAGVFIYAGGTKLAKPIDFADSIATFQLVPNGLIIPIALSLPIFEVVIGVLLLPFKTSRTAAFGTILLTFIFAIALAQALLRGIEVDCGCFGSGDLSIGKNVLSLMRDLLMLCAAAFIWWNAIRLKTETDLSSSWATTTDR